MNAQKQTTKIVRQLRSGQIMIPVEFEDQDLLVLREYEGVRIVDAATFLDLLEK